MLILTSELKVVMLGVNLRISLKVRRTLDFFSIAGWYSDVLVGNRKQFWTTKTTLRSGKEWDVSVGTSCNIH